MQIHKAPDNDDFDILKFITEKVKEEKRTADVGEDFPVDKIRIEVNHNVDCLSIIDGLDELCKSLNLKQIEMILPSGTSVFLKPSSN